MVDGDSYSCICNLGYEQRYNYEEEESDDPVDQTSPPECIDIGKYYV